MWVFNSGCHRGRRKRYWWAIELFIPIFINLFTIGVSIKRLPVDKQFLLYDTNLPDYETVLTPADFEMAAEINDYPSAKKTAKGGNDAWDSDAMYNPDKFEGDIANDLNASTVELFVRGAPSDSLKAQYNAIRDRRQLWPNARIPYAISSQYSSYSRSVIASAMQEYSKNTCIQWAPRVASDRDYVYIVPDRGCYSLVGRTGSRQTLSLGNGCIQKGIIIHEMMHAVGFFHEQSRTDRDEFITIMWQNILPGMQGQFEKYTSATTQTLGTEYDYGSIMHYGPNAFTRNGMPTIMPKRHASIGQRTGFSKIDSYKINTLYDCPNYSQSVLAPAVVAQTMRSSTATIPAITRLLIVDASTQRISLPPTSSSKSGTTACKNFRPDCDQLAKQGWCHRNSNWMRDNCPISCGMCNSITANTIAAVTELPLLPDLLVSTSSSNSVTGSCEDLRVDCAELAKRRYCITAQSFTRTYCARSCGFCFVAPATEIPDAGKPMATTLSTLSKNSILITRLPMATFWPTIRPITDSPKTSKTNLTVSRPCRDQKHFCVAWKKSGFCKGIFTDYMKRNCLASCGWCS